MLPFLATFALVSFVAGPLYNRLGAKLLAAVGAACITIAPFVFSMVDADSGYGSLIIGMVILGIGIGSFYPTATTAGVTSVDESQTSLAGGIVYMFQIAGGSIGLGLTTTVFSAQDTFVDGIQAAFRLDAILSLVGFLIALLFVGGRTLGPRPGGRRGARRRPAGGYLITFLPEPPRAKSNPEPVKSVSLPGPPTRTSVSGAADQFVVPGAADRAGRCRPAGSWSLPAADQLVGAAAAGQGVAPGSTADGDRDRHPPRDGDLVVAAVGVDFEAGDRRGRADKLDSGCLPGWCRLRRRLRAGRPNRSRSCCRRA